MLGALAFVALPLGKQVASAATIAPLAEPRKMAVNLFRRREVIAGNGIARDVHAPALALLVAVRKICRSVDQDGSAAWFSR